VASDGRSRPVARVRHRFTPSTPPARVPTDTLRVTYIGHATVLLQTQGLNILTDPIWSERASPLSFAGPKAGRRPRCPLSKIFPPSMWCW